MGSPLKSKALGPGRNPRLGQSQRLSAILADIPLRRPLFCTEALRSALTVRGIRTRSTGHDADPHVLDFQFINSLVQPFSHTAAAPCEPLSEQGFTNTMLRGLFTKRPQCRPRGKRRLCLSPNTTLRIARIKPFVPSCKN